MLLSSNQKLRRIPPPPTKTPCEIITRLTTAVSQNDIQAFDRLLLQVHHADDLMPVLYEALQHDNSAVAGKLLKKSVRTSYQAAIAAVRAKATACLEVFLQEGWDINANKTQLQPPILAYVSSGPLISSRFECNNLGGYFSSEAITDECMTDWLLTHGADLNKTTYIDITPMSIAVRQASPELIKRLLDRPPL